ncbi:hypothetical protein [Burkholderia multivorans]|uniref:hypothetical protein n=1 Tax=Burkholderia multivorans TaxID=87883 RepID=UPI0011B1D6BE|nr:hypothetical protein [Burkholderia multivorans]
MILNRREFLNLGLVSSLAVFSARTFAGNCVKAESTVFVGGVIGFDALERAATSAPFRDTCRGGLYIHAYIWAKLSDSQREKILLNFSGLPTEIEIGIPRNAESWFKQVFKKQYLDIGVNARHAHVNGFNQQSFLVWADFVRVARDYKLEIVAPVFSPNGGQYKQEPFKSSRWDFLREGAKIGGGLTTDSPPTFFLGQPEAYRNFVVDEIKWANGEGLRSTFIISPNKAGPNFMADTQRAVDYLDKRGALPAAWVVENYDAVVPTSYINRIGDTSNKNTVLGVANWLARQVGM